MNWDRESQPAAFSSRDAGADTQNGLNCTRAGSLQCRVFVSLETIIACVEPAMSFRASG